MNNILTIFLFVLFSLFGLFISCGSGSEKVEIVLSDNENKEAVEIKNYDEEALKTSALKSLEEFLSLPYDEESVKMAYDNFYSSSYKEVLAKTRNVKNADEYVASNPSLDFEFEIKIDKVYSIELKGKNAYIDVGTSVYDRVNKSTANMRQTFVMEQENNKWVIN
ncbi:hypothetical protein [Brachyspira pilosicoli]|uniref:hypothetical protein n=1 Tax=Brachyspira pilosicoli TaxID=52584 RepID=UPI0012F4D3E8|nr:hypothetical protein [Brachyspira pilosicoli]